MSETISDEVLAGLADKVRSEIMRSAAILRPDELATAVDATIEIYARQAALRSSAGAVKALEWEEDEAATPFGKYRLYRTDDGYGLSFNYDHLVHVGFNSVGTFEIARDKAASYAQPHYSAAILSALTPAYTPNAEQVTAQPEVCAHGIRWPWACDECDSAAWAERQAVAPLKEGK